MIEKIVSLSMKSHIFSRSKYKNFQRINGDRSARSRHKGRVSMFRHARLAGMAKKMGSQRLKS